MFFDTLRLYQFRNLQQQELHFAKGPNILVGPNGQGKSNFIEALIYLISGKSFRPFKTEHLLAKDHVDKLVYVCANVDEKDKYELKIESRAKITKNNKNYSWAKAVKDLPYVLFSPESLNAIKASSQERRALIDQSLVLLNPENQALIKNYQKVLRQRNRILSDRKNEKLSIKQGDALLDSINPSFFDLAEELMWQRLDLLKKIGPIFSFVCKEIMADKNVEIAVDYVTSEQKLNEWQRADLRPYLEKRAATLVTAEKASGLSLVGPHKHDIYFQLNSYDSRYYCSQGQQRAIILSFKMAKIMYYKRTFGRWPFLFLDDVLSELDAQKRDHLIRFLKESEGQAFITTTDLSFSQDLLELGGRVFEVSEGKVLPEKNEVV
tara:strand:- start:1195 stop:2331 length:1137 start_codon:yes stop_codon:yes gene_type:complete